MKAYVITTGCLFALLALAHVWRALVEGPQLGARPEFVIVTVIALAMCLWAWRVFRTIRS